MSVNNIGILCAVGSALCCTSYHRTVVQYYTELQCSIVRCGAVTSCAPGSLQFVLFYVNWWLSVRSLCIALNCGAVQFSLVQHHAMFSVLHQVPLGCTRWVWCIVEEYVLLCAACSTLSCGCTDVDCCRVQWIGLLPCGIRH